MQIISRASKYEGEGQSYTDAVDMIFDAAVQAIPKEVHPQMIMSQRGQLLMAALSAGVSAGRKDAVDVILKTEGISSYLQDQGEPTVHVLAEAICSAEIGSGSAAPAGAIWTSIMENHKCDVTHLQQPHI